MKISQIYHANCVIYQERIRVPNGREWLFKRRGRIVFVAGGISEFFHDENIYENLKHLPDRLEVVQVYNSTFLEIPVIYKNSFHPDIPKPPRAT